MAVRPHLSQIILGVNDLEDATTRLRRGGLEVIDGGVHPGIGTANRIVPLGGQYLQLLGVVDPPPVPGGVTSR
jgi:Glyoxalase-like domain